MAARLPTEPELMGPVEVAHELGISPKNLYGKNTPKGMPEPYQRLHSTTTWRAEEIKAFAAERRNRRTTA